MRLTLTLASAMTLLAAAAAANPVRVTGEYVEARTAEVFAGGCIMNSEAETLGRQAVLAWRIGSGAWPRSNGQVSLDGLTVVAAIAGDRNLGMREMGGEAATIVRAIITVDVRATAEQRDALVSVARELSGGIITDVVRVDTAAIRFATTPDYIEVSTPNAVSLSVNKAMKHDASCGAMQWFKPFIALTSSAMGTADTHAFAGDGLNTKWSAPNKRSAFYGTFSY